MSYYFNVGDIVHVREDLAEINPDTGKSRYYMDDSENSNCVNDDMPQYAGREAEIVEAYEFGYVLDGCGGWCYSDEMIEEYIHRNDTRWYDEQEDLDLDQLF